MVIGQPIPCVSCSKRNRCSDYNAFHLLVFRSMGDGVEMPACPQFVQAWWRGVEGVIDHSLVSPRPSGSGTYQG